MKNYNRLKNRLTGIILTVISLTFFDGFAFAGTNPNVNTQNKNTKTNKRVKNKEVSVWDNFLNYLKDLNLGDQNSIISFFSGVGLASIPWVIGLLVLYNKYKNFQNAEKELEKNIETEDIIILNAWERILNHRKLKTNEDPEKFCAEEITITEDIQKNIDIIQENIQKKFYNLLPIIQLDPDGRYSFYFSPNDIKNWKSKVTIKKYKDFEPGEKNSINKIFNYICAGLSSMNFESNENLDTIVSRYKIDKSGLGAWTEDNRLLCYLCEKLKGQKGLETFEKFVK